MAHLILELIKKTFIEITGLVFLFMLLIVSAGFSVYLIFRGIAYLHIKKISVSGIECETMVAKKRRKTCAG